MGDDEPFIGIDFGTSNSSMAWFNPRTASAEVVRNAEGEDKTPSVVYFGNREILGGVSLPLNAGESQPFLQGPNMVR
jgi:molecular chaperone DnaK (HSP70)